MKVIREIHRKLDQILGAVERVERLLVTEGKALMDLRTVITDLNTNTTAVAARIDRIIAAGPTPTPADFADLQAISDHLKAMGTDPAAPVPPLPPAATP